LTGILSTILTLLFFIPILGFIVIFIIYKLFSKNTRHSVHKALDLTTIFFIISVHFLLKTIWGHSFFVLIILVMIVTAMAFVVVHWKVKGEIDFTKVMKGFWRFTFLFFFILYVGLTLYGLMERALFFTFSS
jgi:hypothetical protein